MTDNRNLLELTAAEKQDLERWAQSRTLPAGDVFRARLILALADGQSYREMVRGMRTSAATIARWRRRFEQDRLAGLEGRHRGSKPRTATPAVQARVVRRVQQQPSDGSTHWSCRKLAGELGVSKSTVQRILMQARLKPHRLERYLASDDPDFEAKAADIIGLYLEPPQHAAVFCVDEKTAKRHTSAEFIVFLRELVKKARWAKQIHIVLDNLSAHKTKAVEEFLEQNPKVRFHFTPTYSSWLNQVELWFAKIQRDVITRGVFTSVADLARKLRKYIRAYAQAARPFRWTYTDPRRRIRTYEITGTAY